MEKTGVRKGPPLDKGDPAAVFLLRHAMAAKTVRETARSRFLDEVPDQLATDIALDNPRLYK
jgi:hypothetical protein